VDTPVRFTEKEEMGEEEFENPDRHLTHSKHLVVARPLFILQKLGDRGTGDKGKEEKTGTVLEVHANR